jgi:S1-C subfamily serine protease
MKAISGDRRLTFGLLAIAVLLGGCAAKTLSPDLPPLAINRMVADVQQAVATIRTFDPDMKPVGLGTGFFINNQGHLITNHHVLKGLMRRRSRPGTVNPIRSFPCWRTMQPSI